MSTPIQKKYAEEKFYFLLPIEKPVVPERISAVAQEKGLYEKTECHVSLVVEKSAVKIREGLAKSGNPERVKAEILDLFNSLNFEYDLTNDYSFQEKSYTREELDERGLQDEPVHLRRSVVQVVDMPDVEIFYNKVSELLNIEIEIPVPHTTIFAWSDYEKKKDRGIGISSKKDFEMFSKDTIHI
ncbi:MAG: hypothetical protein KGZ37_07355 [Nitrosarchaeum sp.]|nr:hypothetical protein [Nitrosarchaeum sp.]